MEMSEFAPGSVEPTWESLARDYQCPQRLRDAKSGIWPYWAPQAVDENAPGTNNWDLSFFKTVSVHEQYR